MKHVTFIRPNIGNVRASDAMTPLVFAALAARTPEDIERTLIDERLEEVTVLDTDLAAITAETFTARRAYEIAGQYRAAGVPVVMGGYHPTLLPEEASQHADAIVIGDAEGLWEQVLADLRAGSLKPVYRAEQALADIGSLRFDRRIFEGKRYTPVSLAQIGRGCRFACDFCSIHAFYGSNVSQRPLDQIVAELAGFPRRRPVLFVDDNLLGRREDFVRLMRAIAPLRLRWSCQISIDAARDDELIDLMAEAGCMLALIGFESLDRANLVQMRKNWNGVAGDYLDVVRRFHDRGIMIYGTFVLGYDADGPDAWKYTLEFAQRAQLSIANFNPLTPMPGTALYDRLKAQNRLLTDTWWLDPSYRYGQTIFRPAGMTPEQLAAGCFEARRQFYGYGSILRRSGSGPGLWSDPFKLGVMLLANWISRREILRKQDSRLGVSDKTPAMEAAA